MTLLMTSLHFLIPYCITCRYALTLWLSCTELWILRAVQFVALQNTDISKKNVKNLTDKNDVAASYDYRSLEIHVILLGRGWEKELGYRCIPTMYVCMNNVCLVAKMSKYKNIHMYSKYVHQICTIVHPTFVCIFVQGYI